MENLKQTPLYTESHHFLSGSDTEVDPATYSGMQELRRQISNFDPKTIRESVDNLRSECSKIDPKHPCLKFLNKLLEFKDSETIFYSKLLSNSEAPNTNEMQEDPIKGDKAKFDNILLFKENFTQEYYSESMRVITALKVSVEVKDNKEMIKELCYLGKPAYQKVAFDSYTLSASQNPLSLGYTKDILGTIQEVFLPTSVNKNTFNIPIIDKHLRVPLISHLDLTNILDQPAESAKFITRDDVLLQTEIKRMKRFNQSTENLLRLETKGYQIPDVLISPRPCYEDCLFKFKNSHLLPLIPDIALLNSLNLINMILSSCIEFQEYIKFKQEMKTFKEYQNATGEEKKNIEQRNSAKFYFQAALRTSVSMESSKTLSTKAEILVKASPNETQNLEVFTVMTCKKSTKNKETRRFRYQIVILNRVTNSLEYSSPVMIATIPSLIKLYSDISSLLVSTHLYRPGTIHHLFYLNYVFKPTDNLETLMSLTQHIRDRQTLSLTFKQFLRLCFIQGSKKIDRVKSFYELEMLKLFFCLCLNKSPEFNFFQTIFKPTDRSSNPKYYADIVEIYMKQPIAKNAKMKAWKLFPESFYTSELNLEKARAELLKINMSHVRDLMGTSSSSNIQVEKEHCVDPEMDLIEGTRRSMETSMAFAQEFKGKLSNITLEETIDLLNTRPLVSLFCKSAIQGIRDIGINNISWKYLTSIAEAVGQCFSSTSESDLCLQELEKSSIIKDKITTSRCLLLEKLKQQGIKNTEEYFTKNYCYLSLELDGKKWNNHMNMSTFSGFMTALLTKTFKYKPFIADLCSAIFEGYAHRDCIMPINKFYQSFALFLIEEKCSNEFFERLNPIDPGTLELKRLVKYFMTCPNRDIVLEQRTPNGLLSYYSKKLIKFMLKQPAKKQFSASKLIIAAHQPYGMGNGIFQATSSVFGNGVMHTLAPYISSLLKIKEIPTHVITSDDMQYGVWIHKDELNYIVENQEKLARAINDLFSLFNIELNVFKVGFKFDGSISFNSLDFFAYRNLTNFNPTYIDNFKLSPIIRTLAELAKPIFLPAPKLINKVTVKLSELYNLLLMSKLDRLVFNEALREIFKYVYCNAFKYPAETEIWKWVSDPMPSKYFNGELIMTNRKESDYLIPSSNATKTIFSVYPKGPPVEKLPFIFRTRKNVFGFSVWYHSNRFNKNLIALKGILPRLTSSTPNDMIAIDKALNLREEIPENIIEFIKSQKSVFIPRGCLLSNFDFREEETTFKITEMSKSIRKNSHFYSTQAFITDETQSDTLGKTCLSRLIYYQDLTSTSQLDPVLKLKNYEIMKSSPMIYNDLDLGLLQRIRIPETPMTFGGILTLPKEHETLLDYISRVKHPFDPWILPQKSIQTNTYHGYGVLAEPVSKEDSYSWLYYILQDKNIIFILGISFDPPNVFEIQRPQRKPAILSDYEDLTLDPNSKKAAFLLVSGSTFEKDSWWLKRRNIERVRIRPPETFGIYNDYLEQAGFKQILKLHHVSSQVQSKRKDLMLFFTKLLNELE